MSVCAFAATAPTTEIKVDQVGYLPTVPKFAMVASKAPATEFTVRSVQGGQFLTECEWKQGESAV